MLHAVELNTLHGNWESYKYVTHVNTSKYVRCNHRISDYSSNSTVVILIDVGFEEYKCL